MPTPRTTSPGFLHRRLVALAHTLALAVVLILPVAIVAGWLEKLAGPATRPVPPALENAYRYVRALTVRPDVVALAAQGTPEGHWRFVNKAGELFTVATPDEMKNVVPVLSPEARPGARLALYVTQDTVLRDRVALKALPAGIDLNVVAEGQSYRLLRRSEPAGERFFADVRSNLVVGMGDRRLFDETLWQLARPLHKASVRVLALEPGGPTTLPSSPRVDLATKRALIDTLDPAYLAAAMSSVADQTLVIIGRIDHDLLTVKPASGPEQSLVAKDLFKAAADADVNLVVLTTATARQPVGRNGLWQKAADDALKNAQIADFLNALGAPNRRLAAVALPHGKRTLLELVPAGNLPAITAARPVAELVAGAVAEITARTPITSVQASLRNADRQQEYDQRFVPGIPSEVQIVYGLLVVFGLFGVPVSRDWWQRLWPPEVASEYAGQTGYWAACATRWLAFALIFVPLTAAVSAPYNIGRQAREAVAAPLRLWQRLANLRATLGSAATRGEDEGQHQWRPPPPPVGRQERRGV
jgi:hypothetical protein